MITFRGAIEIISRSKSKLASKFRDYFSDILLEFFKGETERMKEINIILQYRYEQQ